MKLHSVHNTSHQLYFLEYWCHFNKGAEINTLASPEHTDCVNSHSDVIGCIDYGCAIINNMNSTCASQSRLCII